MYIHCVKGTYIRKGINWNILRAYLVGALHWLNPVPIGIAPIWFHTESYCKKTNPPQKKKKHSKEIIIRVYTWKHLYFISIRKKKKHCPFHNEITFAEKKNNHPREFWWIPCLENFLTHRSLPYSWSCASSVH